MCQPLLPGKLENSTAKILIIKKIVFPCEGNENVEQVRKYLVCKMATSDVEKSGKEGGNC